MGCAVDTITLSVEQCNLARERVEEAGVSDVVRVHLMDYRELPPEFHKAFDACISIEMLEVNAIILNCRRYSTNTQISRLLEASGCLLISRPLTGH